MSCVVVVTRTKNRPLLLKRAIQSVQQQSYSDYIHVIVNDGGQKAAVNELVEAACDAKIHVIHNEESLGMEAASNIGLKYQPATYAVIHDDDDSWHSDFLKIMVDYLEGHPHQAGVVCNIIQCFESVKDNSVTRVSSRLFNPAVKTFRLNDFLVINQFVPIAFLYRYSLHEELGFYNEQLQVCGDVEFYLRTLKSHNIAKISNLLANYHIRVEHKNPSLNNSIMAKNTHKAFSRKVLMSYDNRHFFQKTSAFLRVRVIYRLINVFIRLLNKYGRVK